MEIREAAEVMRQLGEVIGEWSLMMLVITLIMLACMECTR